MIVELSRRTLAAHRMTWVIVALGLFATSLGLIIPEDLFPTESVLKNWAS